MILIAKKAEIMIIIGRFIGIFISGSDLSRFEDLAFFAIRRIRIPVIPAEITPPIPSIRVKLRMLKNSVRMYRVKGTREVRMKFLVLVVLMSRRNVEAREKERTK